MATPRIVNVNAVGSETPPDGSLPAAGFKRNEEFLRREDYLQQQAEEVAKSLGLVRFDPKSVKLDSAVVQELLKADVVSHSTGPPTPGDFSGKQEGYTYCWVPMYQNGLYVKQKQYEKWELISGDMPEGREHKQADGMRRCADVLLMRVRTDVYVVLKLAQRTYTQEVKAGISANFEERGEQYRRSDIGVITHTDPATDSFFLDKFPGYVANQMATKKMNTHIKNGTVPGAEMPRR